ncbi:MAG TPA: amidase family protein [Steroidobacteraceae bacterium]|nr:amidase family protein [Steroidobacteraceae bacterium]
MSTPAIRILFLAVLLTPSLASGQSGAQNPIPTQHNEATVAQLQAQMASGMLTSEELTREYIARILGLDQSGPGVNAVIELNPDALVMARNADALRRQGIVKGPLHGIPVLLKDNIDTGDKMQTSAGSFALVGMPALRDSTVAANLRAGGAVILGKTNLSEWANFRSFESISGWSGRGGQTHNPYGIDRNPCGSSSGSGAAASANFAAVSFGSETDGSIVCPANANGVVGIKPTVGLTSRAGVVPISHTQDTVGPHGRTVADAAAALSVIQSRTFDGRDPATGGVPLGWQGTGKTRPKNIPTDYTKFVNPSGLQGARLGVTRVGLGGFDPFVPTPPQVLDAFEAAVDELTAAGATVIDLDAAGFTFASADGEFLVLLFDFRNDVRAYFGTRVGVPVAGGTLQSAIDFDNADADVEMPFFNQDIFDLANALAPGPDDPQPIFGGLTYNQALAIDHNAGVNGIDAAISQFNLDAVVSATDNPAWSTDLLYGDHFIFGTSGLAAGPGYPIIQVPAGFPKLCASLTQPTNCTQYGVPLGISFFGTAFSEPTLIKLASGFEAATQVRAHNLPTFAATAPSTNIQGTTLTKPTRRAAPAPTGTAKKVPHHL